MTDSNGVIDADRLLDLADVMNSISRVIRLRAAHSSDVTSLTPTQSLVMRRVRTHPASSATEIADACDLKLTNVSATVRELRRLGYLVTEQDEHDGRVTRLRATERADEVNDLLRASWGAQLLSGWARGHAGSAAELDRMVTMLDALHDGLYADRATFGVPTEAPAAD